ncbi:MAG: hypothetical protein ABJB34_11605, partial [Acidobacteriota bacterium]
GAYIDGTDPFDLGSKDGDLNFREIPVEVEAGDLRYSAKGYDPNAVIEDRNSQIPIDRLTEYQANAVIGSLNNVWWSLSSWIPNARLVADELAPKLAARLHRYEIPTMMLSVDPVMTDRVRPPRTAYYKGEFGSVAGRPGWREYQLRVLDEAIRWTETFDQPGARKLAVDLETAVEASRGER